MNTLAADPLFAPVVAAFASDPDVTHDEKLFGSKPLKVRGKIFAMLVGGNLVVKLPKEVVESLVCAGRGQRFDPGHGRLMREWIVLPARDQDRWVGLAQQARGFVGSDKRR